MDNNRYVAIKKQKLNTAAFSRRQALVLLAGFLAVFFAAAGFCGLSPARAAAPQDAVISFSDVPGHWAESDVTRLAALELVVGYPDRTDRKSVV